MIICFLVNSGDDCISIGAGSHNLDIRNVTCGPGHGIRYYTIHYKKSSYSITIVRDNVPFSTFMIVQKSITNIVFLPKFDIKNSIPS